MIFKLLITNCRLYDCLALYACVQHNCNWRSGICVLSSRCDVCLYRFIEGNESKPIQYHRIFLVHAIMPHGRNRYMPVACVWLVYAYMCVWLYVCECDAVSRVNKLKAYRHKHGCATECTQLCNWLLIWQQQLCGCAVLSPVRRDAVCCAAVIIQKWYVAMNNFGRVSTFCIRSLDAHCTHT